MTSDMYAIAALFIIPVILLFISGLYCIMVTRNLIRVLIGVELIAKAVTLLIILAGYVTNNMALAQAIVITVIIIEVVVLAVAAGIVLNIFKYNNSLDARNIRNLKG